MKQALHPFDGLSSRWLVIAAFCALLTACGGGQDTSSSVSLAANAEPVNAFAATTQSPPSAQTTALQKEGARLNSDELAQIAKTGVLPEPFEGKLLSGAGPEPVQGEGGFAEAKSLGQAKSAASRVPVFRFFNNQTNAHFFTTSTTERDSVQATLAYMSYEGPAFYSSATTIPGLSPVHRFYNTQTGVHFYTISEAERANVVANLPQFNYEGIAYYASTLAGTGYTPLYRFFYASKGFHFYTNSLGERDNIIATLPQYSYEGVGYYVLGSDWQTPAVPHTGITSARCYQANSDVFVACGGSGATTLNFQQDGHRADINALSYSAVGSNALTSCVKDNVTGLIWEGKTKNGFRSLDNRYTNLGNNATDDVSAYVHLLNGLALCGFNDWRLPTVQELRGIEKFGGIRGDPRVDVDWFPNTSPQYYWASDVLHSDPTYGWRADFGFFGSALQVSLRSHTNSVRLVRGATWAGPRYLITSLSYTGDAANNAAIDRQTGLIWRRCQQGQVWNGTACTGTPALYTHNLALIFAHNGSWRMPNIKELGSLVDYGRASPALDSGVFPGTNTAFSWTTTPGDAADFAGFVEFGSGFSYDVKRTVQLPVRLVRSYP
ncbi:DUF1566 domain-containing protein [Hydrogenophaga crassostreae]|nr:DUF1566 domain-containing protein [Hydrogenophaga crassostreae]